MQEMQEKLQFTLINDELTAYSDSHWVSQLWDGAGTVQGHRSKRASGRLFPSVSKESPGGELSERGVEELWCLLPYMEGLRKGGPPAPSQRFLSAELCISQAVLWVYVCVFNLRRIWLQKEESSNQNKTKSSTPISVDVRIFTQREPFLMPLNEESDAHELSKVEPRDLARASSMLTAVQKHMWSGVRQQGQGQCRKDVGEDTACELSLDTGKVRVSPRDRKPLPKVGQN